MSNCRIRARRWYWLSGAGLRVVLVRDRHAYQQLVSHHPAQEGVGAPPGDVGAGVPGIDFGSLRAGDGNIHLWATLRESPNCDQPS